MSRRRDDNRTKRTIAGRLLTVVLLFATIVSIASLSISLVAPYFASTHSWVFPFFGLIAPTIYISSVALALILIIRWQWRLAAPIIILLLIGSPRISLFVKIPVGKDYGLESYKGSVKFMTYNVRGLADDNSASSVDRVVEYIEQEKPDVIAFQEYSVGKEGKQGRLSSQLSRYNVAQYGTNAIYSRYPILRKGDIFKDADSLGGRSIYADLLIGSDTIRVINNHLNSNSIDKEDKAYLRATNVIRDTKRNERLNSIIHSFGDGSAERTAQVRVIRASMESSPYRYIVSGDFNDAPISFSYYELSRGMKDTFVECGDGYSYTYRGFYNLLRIDYILVSDGITPLSYHADREIKVSDHIPVISHLKIDKKP